MSDVDRLDDVERWTLSGEAVILPTGPAIVTAISGPWVPCGERIEVVRADAYEGAVDRFREWTRREDAVRILAGVCEGSKTAEDELIAALRDALRGGKP